MNNLSLSPAYSNVHTKTFLLEEHNKSMKGMSPDPPQCTAVTKSQTAPHTASLRKPPTQGQLKHHTGLQPGSVRFRQSTPYLSLAGAATSISQIQTKHPILIIGRSCHKYQSDSDKAPHTYHWQELPQVSVRFRQSTPYLSLAGAATSISQIQTKHPILIIGRSCHKYQSDSDKAPHTYHWQELPQVSVRFRQSTPYLSLAGAATSISQIQTKHPILIIGRSCHKYQSDSDKAPHTYHWQELPQVSVRFRQSTPYLSLAGAATSISQIQTKHPILIIGRSCHKYQSDSDKAPHTYHWQELPQVSFCHDKTFVMTNVFVVTNHVCCDKTRLLFWQKYACHDKVLSQQKTFFCSNKHK